MVLAKKQNYQQLDAKFPLSVKTEEKAKDQGQKYWKSNIYQLPFCFLLRYFLYIKQRNGNFFIPDVNKTSVIQKVIGAVHHKFLVAIETVGPFIVSQFQGTIVS